MLPVMFHAWLKSANKSTEFKSASKSTEFKMGSVGRPKWGLQLNLFN